VKESCIFTTTARRDCPDSLMDKGRLNTSILPPQNYLIFHPFDRSQRKGPKILVGGWVKQTALRQSKQCKILWISSSRCSWKNTEAEVKSVRVQFSFLLWTQDEVVQKAFRCPTSGTSVQHYSCRKQKQNQSPSPCLSSPGNTRHWKTSFYPLKNIQNYNAQSDGTGTRHIRCRPSFRRHQG